MSRNLPVSLLSALDANGQVVSYVARAADSSTKKTGRNLASLLSEVPQELQNDIRAGANILEKYDMSNVRARVCAVIDVSRSMENPNKFVSSGALAYLFNKFFSLGILFDDNQEIEIFFLGDNHTDYAMRAFSKQDYLKLKEVGEFSSFIEKIFSELLEGAGLAETTYYDKPIEKLLKHYFSENEKTMWKYDDPVFCAFLTDGEPTGSSGLRAKGLIHNAAQKGMPIFFKFLALQGLESNFPLLRKIDDDDTRRFDNTDLVEVLDPMHLTMEDLINEFRGFLVDTHKMGLIDDHYGVKEVYSSEEGRVQAKELQPVVQTMPAVAASNAQGNGVSLPPPFGYPVPSQGYVPSAPPSFYYPPPELGYQYQPQRLFSPPRQRPVNINAGGVDNVLGGHPPKQDSVCASKCVMQ